VRYVIGSGPSGVSCARALIDAGRPVTILDAGQDRDSQPPTLQSEKLDALPRKLIHGSDFPYRPAPGAIEIAWSETAAIEGSYAVGGLSNVWGAAVLPHHPSDLKDWPISFADLAPHYAAVTRFMPVAAATDDLEGIFPLERRTVSPLFRSRQAQAFLSTLAKNKTHLNQKGVFFGESRLAVAAASSADQGGCVYCGQCLHGCPHGLIYNSRDTLAELARRDDVSHIHGVTVQSLEERGGAAFIRGVGPDGAPCIFEAERVFLAAGPLNSTAILLRSLARYDRPTRLADSQYFLLPLLRFRATPEVEREALHTMAQAFVEVLDPKVSEPLVHLQIYSYNDHLSQALDQKLGPLKRVFPRSALLGRLLVVQGYLHSALSAKIALTLKRGAGSDTLHVDGEPNAQTLPTINRLIAKLFDLSRNMGAVPLKPLLIVAPPGRGFHSGGSFPLSRTPGEMETDLLGRPSGFERIHVVDASVLPSVPATTITFTIMANAHRIGTEAARLA